MKNIEGKKCEKREKEEKGWEMSVGASREKGVYSNLDISAEIREKKLKYVTLEMYLQIK